MFFYETDFGIRFILFWNGSRILFHTPFLFLLSLISVFSVLFHGSSASSMVRSWWLDEGVLKVSLQVCELTVVGRSPFRRGCGVDEQVRTDGGWIQLRTTFLLQITTYYTTSHNHPTTTTRINTSSYTHHTNNSTTICCNTYTRTHTHTNNSTRKGENYWTIRYANANAFRLLEGSCSEERNLSTISGALSSSYSPWGSL